MHGHMCGRRLYVVSAGVDVDTCIEFSGVHMCMDACADVDFMCRRRLYVACAGVDVDFLLMFF